MREMNETMTAYVPLDEVEERRKNKDKRRPVSIVVPLSFTIVDTLLTSLVGAFLEDPIHRYRGTGPEDAVKALLAEKVINRQSVSSPSAR